MPPLVRRLLVGLLFGVVVLIALGVYADGRSLLASLEQFDWWVLVPVLGLTLVNYAMRFAKWQYYLRVLGHRIPTADSALVFLAGFSMAVTPGKFGELLKAVLLRERRQTPATDTASVVIAERATDFISLVLLAASGVMTTRHGVVVLAIAAGGSVLFLAMMASEALAMRLIGLVSRFPGLGRLAPKLTELYRAMARLLRPAPLVATLVLSTAAWFCECIGFYLILTGLPGTSPDLATCTFVYAFATIFGAVTMLPGGLGATEGSLIGMSFAVFTLAATRTVATAGALLIRFCTLWFGVLVGLVALTRFRGVLTGDRLRADTP